MRVISIITPVTWSFINHSNILICCSKNINYYVENSRVDFFFWFLWWIESSEEQHLYNINVFIITFDQFKASLLNKSINFYNFSSPPNKRKKIYTDSKWVAAENKQENWATTRTCCWRQLIIIENAVWFSASRRCFESGRASGFPSNGCNLSSSTHGLYFIR